MFKDLVPFDTVSGAEDGRYLKVRTGEHIGVLPLTFKKTKPSKGSSLWWFSTIYWIADLLILLTNRINKFVLEIKKSLLIKQNRLVLNKSISSAKLFLFESSWLFNRSFMQQYWIIIVCIVLLFSQSFMNIVIFVKIGILF